MLKHIAHFLTLSFIFIFSGVVCEAAPIRIVGMGQYELINPFDSSTRLIASSRLIVVVDGSKYRISTMSTMGEAIMRVGAETKEEEYGSDGVDTFLVTDRPTPVRYSGGANGIIFSGRFPDFCSILVQAVWLGYCSDGYFENPTNHTSLSLSEFLAWTAPENVTNLVKYWPSSTLPQEITGWSRNWVKLSQNDQPVELKHYPNGFKDWKFVASDGVLIGNVRLPRRIVLESFVPKRPQDATSGDETTLIRRVNFVADSVEIETNVFDPLPPIPTANMPVNDKRFLKEIWPKILATEISPATGWPTRSSLAFNGLKAQAADLGYDNMRDHPKPKRAVTAIFIICGINLIILFMIIRMVRKNKLNNNTK